MELRGFGNGNERHKLAVGGGLSERHHNRENSRHIRKPAASRMGRRAKPYRPVGKVAIQLRGHKRLPRKPENLCSRDDKRILPERGSWRHH